MYKCVSINCDSLVPEKNVNGEWMCDSCLKKEMIPFCSNLGCSNKLTNANFYCKCKKVGYCSPKCMKIDCSLRLNLIPINNIIIHSIGL